ncbi:MAG TPA: PAS domain S-box protein [Candidatus Limnocylindria bacterium]|nr:PAS domain S-box protein [Candidatus Limnocylindria bacterium]
MESGLAAEFFRRVLATELLPYVRWTFNEGVLTANDLFLDMIGYSRSEFENHAIDWDGITPAEYWSLDERCIDQLLRERIAAPYVKEFFRKDGSRVAVRIFEGWKLLEPEIGITIAVELAEADPQRDRTPFYGFVDL